MAYVVLVIGQLGKLVGITPEGDIPSGLPAVRLPDAGLGDGLTLLPAALGIFFVSYSGEILTARAFAGDRGEHVRADTELGAMGAASLAAGIGIVNPDAWRAWPGPAGSRSRSPPSPWPG